MSLPSFFKGKRSSEFSLAFSFWPSLAEELSSLNGDFIVSGFVKVSDILPEEAIGDLISEEAFSMLELLNFSFIPILSSFSPRSFPSGFALLGSVLFAFVPAEMVNVNLGLCEGDARGTDGAWFDVGVVDGLVTVEVDDG